MNSDTKKVCYGNNKYNSIEKMICQLNSYKIKLNQKKKKKFLNKRLRKKNKMMI